MKIVKSLLTVILIGIAFYFFPWVTSCYLVCGIYDVARSRPLTFDRVRVYFTANGFFTWAMSPINVLLDVLSLPFINRGIYQLTDLPAVYQADIKRIIEIASEEDIVGGLEQRMNKVKRGMIFFKWFGRNLETSYEIPAYHTPFQYVQTIGISIFNNKVSTNEHFGPLRATFRVLYNVNDLQSRDSYIKVGGLHNHWCDQKLFIFDDTLMHQSVNQTTELRYCLYLDILRPSLCPWLLRAVVRIIGVLMLKTNAIFYKKWVQFK